LAVVFSAAGLTGAWFAFQALDRPITIDRPVVVAQTQRPAAKPLPAAGQFRMPPMGSFQAILDRPAFSPSRRPEEGAPVVVNQDLAVRVTGISGTPTMPLANLVPRGGGDAAILRQGQQYRGWVLSEIDSTSKSVLFRRGDEEVRVEMEFEAAPTPVKPRPDARLPTGAQRNLGQDRTRQQQTLRQKRLQERQERLQQRQQNQRLIQNQQNQPRQNLQEEGSDPEDPLNVPPN
jgi:hypothetical protein